MICALAWCTSQHVEPAGIIVGLAIHNGHILSLSLARALYKKLLGSPLGLDDLQEMHAGVFNSLKHLLAHAADRVEDDMGLTFQAWFAVLPLVPAWAGQQHLPRCSER